MTIAKIIELLEIEHECMLRKSRDACDSHCGICELVQDDGELHEMYTDVIAIMKAMEPVKPAYRRGKAFCGVCGLGLHRVVEQNNYCPNCGHAIKWG